MSLLVYISKNTQKINKNFKNFFKKVSFISPSQKKNPVSSYKTRIIHIQNSQLFLIFLFFSVNWKRKRKWIKKKKKTEEGTFYNLVLSARKSYQKNAGKTLEMWRHPCTKTCECYSFHQDHKLRRKEQTHANFLETPQ